MSVIGDLRLPLRMPEAVHAGIDLLQNGPFIFKHNFHVNLLEYSHQYLTVKQDRSSPNALWERCKLTLIGAAPRPQIHKN